MHFFLLAVQLSPTVLQIEASAFDKEVFCLVMENAAAGGDTVEAEAEKVMEYVARACASMPRRKSNNHRPLVYWWNK